MENEVSFGLIYVREGNYRINCSWDKAKHKDNTPFRCKEFMLWAGEISELDCGYFLDGNDWPDSKEGLFKLMYDGEIDYEDYSHNTKCVYVDYRTGEQVYQFVGDFEFRNEKKLQFEFFDEYGEALNTLENLINKFSDGTLKSDYKRRKEREEKGQKIAKSKKIYYSNEDDYSSGGKGSDWSVNELIDLIKSNPNLKLRAVSSELCYGVFQIKNSNYPNEIFASQKVEHSYFLLNMPPNELSELVKNPNYDPKKEAYQTRFHFWEYGSIDNKTLLDSLNEFVNEDESNKATEISEFLYWYAENSGNWTPEMFVNSLLGGDGEYNQGITSNANLLQENISEKTKNDIGFYIIEDSIQTDYGIFEIL